MSNKRRSRSSTSTHSTSSNKMTSSDTPPTAINYKYDLNALVPSINLIRAVKKYEILYNSQLQNYTDHVSKEPIWNKVHRELYPKYDELPHSTRSLIRKVVRRRWKTLRNTFGKSIRRNSFRKGDNAMLNEMEFLAPYIKFKAALPLSPQPQVTESWNGEENDNNEFENVANENNVVNAADVTDDVEEEFNDMVDLTYEEKPVLKIDPAERAFESLNELNNCENDANAGLLYPTIQMTTGADGSCIENGSDRASTTGTNNEQWRNGFCVTDFSDTGDYENANSTPDMADVAETRQMPAHLPPLPQLSQATQQTQSMQQSQLPPTPQLMQAPNNRKRPRSPSTEKDYRTKILKMLSEIDRRDDRYDRDESDEDRMFLLSLVSDLRGIPTVKKMLVKAEIVTAIARGQQ